MLREIYDLLPAHVLPFVRFAVHSGMRLNEITSLRWGAVNLEGGTATVLPQFAKNKRQREVPLGKVAGEILTRLRPESPAPSDAVFLGRRGGAIRSVREAFDRAVLTVWSPSKPGERKPTFHDLRATCGTRVEAVSSYATVKLLLGHSTVGDVTSGYIRPSLDSVRDALNRAARSIDGTAPEGTILFPSRGGQAPETARLTASTADSGAAGAR
jgi:integrase